LPLYGGIHVQRAAPSRAVHWAFSPQGDGLQGSGGKGGFGSAETDNKSKKYTCTSQTTFTTPGKIT